jgi:hypothetical protein
MVKNDMGLNIQKAAPGGTTFCALRFPKVQLKGGIPQRWVYDYNYSYRGTTSFQKG